MSDAGVILITGVNSYWGSKLADRLLSESQYHVIGIDPQTLAKPNQNLDFIQTDLRNPALTDLLRTENIHTICHLAFMEHGLPDAPTLDANLKGSINLFRASAEAGVKKIVIKSSTSVYGARPSNPSFLNEDYPLHGSNTSAAINGLVELENYCSSFTRHNPDIKLSVLRFANIIGPQVNSPLTNLLSRSYPSSLLGFNPQFQIIHENDVIEALSLSIHQDIHGAFNIAADGILPLNKIIGLSGKIRLPIFHPIAYWGAKLLPELNNFLFLDDPNYLRYPCVGDTTRMKEEMGFSPHYTAEEALADFKLSLSKNAIDPEASFPPEEEERLRAMLANRQALNDHPTPNMDIETFSTEGSER